MENNHWVTKLTSTGDAHNHGSWGSDCESALVTTQSGELIQPTMSQTQRQWHNILGHYGETKMRSILKSGWIKGTGLTRESCIKSDCVTCAVAKQPLSNFTDKADYEKAVVPGGCFHIDLASCKIPSISDKKIFMGIVDEYSGTPFVILLDSKDQAAPELIKFFTLFHSKRDRWPARIRSDNEIEFTSGVLESFLKEHGIDHTFNPTYTLQLRRD
jgi:hypothetical protein